MKCAYVTLVMLGDNYVKGAIALGKSLVRTGTENEMVCMVSDDVTQLKELHKLYRVINVPYLHYKCGKMLTERQQQLYSNWINFSFTKWRCFELNMYDRCIFLDADQIVLRNIDHLFHYPNALCYNYNYSCNFKHLKHGDVVSYDAQKYILDNSNVLGFSGTLVFEPNLKMAKTIESLLSPDNDKLNEAINIYNNGFDEIVLAQAFIMMKKDVVQLSPMYVWAAGNYNALKNGQQPYIINYYGDQKPWTLNDAIYMDIYIWWFFYNN
ncbi:p13 [Adoxophyes orana granulovirus]|uniref:p13 n=1 Tax=Adoxophyes orana granulovirus TaxID=170617 RepID=Q7T9X7_GVAO|nr:p13 [Adoxophyes orana granulovirus]AAP85675.1 p13 [Adoxophyes orana granulovirus]